jgi:hypothetical protein
MPLYHVFESTTEVFVPGAGTLLRVELLAPDGESLGVEYRLPGQPRPASLDHTFNFVVLVTAAAVSPFECAPRIGLPDKTSRCRRAATRRRDSASAFDSRVAHLPASLLRISCSTVGSKD